jgi:hypothetical protein
MRFIVYSARIVEYDKKGRRELKLVIKTLVFAILAMGFYHGDVHASEMDLSAACSKFGAIKPNQNPSFQLVNCLLTNAALAYDVPPEVVKAVASQETGWKQFDQNGNPIVSADGGIGLMQVTNQPEFNQDQLKNDIVYNIKAGVEILSNNYAWKLPKIKDADRHVLENWYFPVMAYNGIKPVNSPFVKDKGTRNLNAYQEKVFAKIGTDSLLGTKLAQIPFQASDFEYDSTSSGNIQFVKTEYVMDEWLWHSSPYFLKTGDKAVSIIDNVRVRTKPSTSGTLVKSLLKNASLTINGQFVYDPSSSSLNQFVWIPVKTSGGKTGYISSAAISPPNVCSPYQKGQKIYWDGSELKPGMIGRLTILQNTSLFTLKGTKQVFSRTLKKGEYYRIYAFKPGMLSVGGGYYVMRDSKVKYETPSKTKLIAVKCISNF